MSFDPGRTTTLRPLRETRIERVEIILKTVEVCNIACDYCYFFFGGNDTFMHHPKYIARDTVKRIVDFIRRGVTEDGIQEVAIDLHGGEPLMQKPADFDWMCQHFREVLDPICRLKLNLQTNAMLINDTWIALFEKHAVNVGVSIDGPAEVNDIHRRDRLGRGTHKRTIEGIRKLQAAVDNGSVVQFGALCVIEPSTDPAKMFHYFADELDLDSFDFLMPVDKQPPAPAEDYGRFLTGLFDAWVANGDTSIRPRFLSAFFARLRGHTSFQFPHGEDAVTSRVIKISSDGTVYPDDILYLEHWDTPKVEDASLGAFLRSEHFTLVDNLYFNPPEACTECCWREVCSGGHPWNRHTDERQFDNPSSLCAALKDIYAHCVSFLLANGTTMDEVLDMLKLDRPALPRESHTTPGVTADA